jgi:dTDP-4-amino-4,6-dideoxygalactose transaminase
MDRIMKIAHKHDLFVIEDAAHAIDSFYHGKALGSIGHFGTFSFHDTKTIISGEGGLLAINDERFKRRSEIIWEKGTNRVEFARGEVDKYGWVDIGSSFLPSEITASFLYAQLEGMKTIQQKRIDAWNLYRELLAPLYDDEAILLPEIPSWAAVNGNMFFILTTKPGSRDKLLKYLQKRDILAVFHYLPLHNSQYFNDKHDGRDLPNTEHFSSNIIRLPLFTDITEEEIVRVVEGIKSFYKST